MSVTGISTWQFYKSTNVKNSLVRHFWDCELLKVVLKWGRLSVYDLLYILYSRQLLSSVCYTTILCHKGINWRIPVLRKVNLKEMMKNHLNLPHFTYNQIQNILNWFPTIYGRLTFCKPRYLQWFAFKSPNDKLRSIPYIYVVYA